MTEQSGYFSDGTYYSQNTFAGTWEETFGHDGVVAGNGNQLSVEANNPANMVVKVNTGKSFVRGYFHEITESPVTLLIDTADTTNPRIDRVVLHLRVNTTTSENRGLKVAVLKGTPASSPVAPALTQTADVWEIPLYQVMVRANTTTIIATDLTDERQYMWFKETNQPKASKTRYGACKAGVGIDVDDGVISISPFGAVPIPNTSTTNTDGFKVGESISTIPARSWNRISTTDRTKAWNDAYTFTHSYVIKNCHPFVVTSSGSPQSNVVVSHEFVFISSWGLPGYPYYRGLRAVNQDGTVLATHEEESNADTISLTVPLTPSDTSVKIQFYAHAIEEGTATLIQGSAGQAAVSTTLYYNPVVEA